MVPRIPAPTLTWLAPLAADGVTDGSTLTIGEVTAAVDVVGVVTTVVVGVRTAAEVVVGTSEVVVNPTAEVAVSVAVSVSVADATPVMVRVPTLAPPA